jgi:hypothetical protein
VNELDYRRWTVSFSGCGVRTTGIVKVAIPDATYSSYEEFKETVTSVLLLIDTIDQFHAIMQ